MKLVDIIKKSVNIFNIDIKKYPSSDLRRRQKLLKHFGINKVLDIGANQGQYAKSLRGLGFDGEIISFEPLTKVYSKLVLATKNDNKWTTHNFALGDKEEEIKINIAGNLFSSSIMEMTSIHKDSAQESAYMDEEKITVKTLDQIYNDLIVDGDKVLLKIDVQGYEKNVIEGAFLSLPKIAGIQIEMSLEELYKGEMLFSEMVDLLHKYGFKLYSLENGFYNNKTGQLLQVDGIFFRDE